MIIFGLGNDLGPHIVLHNAGSHITTPHTPNYFPVSRSGGRVESDPAIGSFPRTSSTTVIFIDLIIRKSGKAILKGQVPETAYDTLVFGKTM